MQEVEIRNRIDQLKADLIVVQLEADAKKLIANGTFGKTNDSYSAIYDPYIMSCVTVNGQLALIALIAMVHDVGGNVVSANTDGITIQYPKELESTIKEVVTEWETLTKLNMEYCEYLAFYQKDVNNYIACANDGDIKSKGVFNIPKVGGVDMEHTPSAQIVARAVRDRLDSLKDMTLTITECRDIQEFLLTESCSRDYSVTWRGQPLDNMVRFYKAVNGSEIIKTPKAHHSAGTAAILSNSTSCVPLPNLPETFDSIPDIDYDWYISEAHKLFDIVAKPKIEGNNKIAYEFETKGMVPAIITIGNNNRQNPKSGEVDFSAMRDDETFAICTGRHYGVIAQRFATGETYFYQVDRKYKSRTRDKVMKDHGFEFIFGSNVEVAPHADLHQIDQDWLDQFYTESELVNARK